MKKKIFLLSAVTMLLIGCDSSIENDVTIEQSNLINETSSIENEVYEEKTVEIVLNMTDFNEDANIEKYVNELNQNNDEEFYVYDETHYAKKITESERKEFLKKIESDETNFEIINSLNETYPDVYKEVTISNNGQLIQLYVDKDVYEQSDWGIGIFSCLVASLFSDNIQAYNLIDINERKCIVEIIDLKTNEIIYTTE